MGLVLPLLLFSSIIAGLESDENQSLKHNICLNVDQQHTLPSVDIVKHVSMMANSRALFLYSFISYSTSGFGKVNERGWRKEREDVRGGD